MKRPVSSCKLMVQQATTTNAASIAGYEARLQYLSAELEPRGISPITYEVDDQGRLVVEYAQYITDDVLDDKTSLRVYDAIFNRKHVAPVCPSCGHKYLQLTRDHGKPRQRTVCFACHHEYTREV